jgi:hypothetical protein
VIIDEIKQLKTERTDLRKFGLLVGSVFAILGLLFWVRGKTFYPWVLAPGLILLLLGALVPAVLKSVYLAWMSIAILLGFVVSTALLTVFFFLVITPTGLVARLLGKDFLRLELRRQDQSYWVRRPNQTPSSKRVYERQF